MIDVLRTPDERLRGLPGYDFAPSYANVRCSDDPTELRMHYVDAGPRHGKNVLLLHGEPTWSYLYRDVIATLVANGRRVIAPDFIGFGRSDKPAQREAYTYRRHIEWTGALLSSLDLRDMAIFMQDWGGLVGLRLVVAQPERFSHVIVANTGLPTGDEKVPDAFLAWRAFSQNVPVLNCADLMARACLTKPADAVLAAYEAPYPDESFKAGARQFPMLVPAAPDNVESAANREAWAALAQWNKPFLTAFSDSDPITRGADRRFTSVVPGAANMPHLTIEGAGHFLQEEKPAEVAAAIERCLAAG